MITATADADAHRIRILLVEDHRAVRESLRLMLETQRDMVVVGEVDEGTAAVELTSRTSPGVVIMDISMPGMNGLMATRAIRRFSPAAKVLVLTRHQDPAFSRELMDAGATGYVLKQSAATELIRAVRVVAEGREYVDPALPPLHSNRQGVPATERAGTALVTTREEEVLRHVAWGQTNSEIADVLGLSVKTVEAHKANAMRKLRFKTRLDVVRLAVLKGWLNGSEP
jgi:DNA-binding NarL/FixJ family response regulator